MVTEILLGLYLPHSFQTPSPAVVYPRMSLGKSNIKNGRMKLKQLSVKMISKVSISVCLTEEGCQGRHKEQQSGW